MALLVTLSVPAPTVPENAPLTAPVRLPPVSEAVPSVKVPPDTVPENVPLTPPVRLPALREATPSVSVPPCTMPVVVILPLAPIDACPALPKVDRPLIVSVPLDPMLPLVPIVACPALPKVDRPLTVSVPGVAILPLSLIVAWFPVLPTLSVLLPVILTPWSLIVVLPPVRLEKVSPVIGAPDAPFRITPVTPSVVRAAPVVPAPPAVTVCACEAGIPVRSAVALNPASKPIRTAPSAVLFPLVILNPQTLLTRYAARIGGCAGRNAKRLRRPSKNQAQLLVAVWVSDSQV